MSSLALRYPREHLFETFRGNPGGLNTSTSVASTGAGTATFDNGCGVLKAPARYSQVRKVIFYLATGRSGTGTTSEVKLSIARASTTTPTATLKTFSIPANSSKESTVTSFALDPQNKIAYTHLGPQTTVGQAAIVGSSKEDEQIFLLQIEFDRFSSNSVDFFADWDAITNADTYLYLMPVISQVSSDSAVAHSWRFKSFGCVVVQAPGAPNNSCIEWPVFGGVCDSVADRCGAIRTTYDSVFRPARTAFRYHAADWDGISGVHAVMAGSSRGGAGRTVTVKVSRLTSQNTESIILEEGHAIGANSWWLIRTADFKASLVDGADYFLDFKMTGAAPTEKPWPAGYVEIIQQNFTKTVCKHSVNHIKVTLPPDTVKTNSGASLFDPSWYNGFSAERVQTRKFFSGLLFPASASNNVNQAIRSDAVLQSNDSSRGSATAVDLFTHNVSGATPDGIQLTESTITTGSSVDLMASLGQRRLQLSIAAGTWTAPATAIPGMMLLYYGLLVPDAEFPELGSVFPIGAFNPDGCASTAAGLGDPGVLVITNGSTIPKKFNPLAGTVEDNGVPTPFEDEVPGFTVHDNVSSPDGGLGSGIYKYRYTLRNCCTGKESDPNPDDLSVDTTGASPAANVIIEFGGLRIPGDEQICEICVYRTVLGGDFPVMAKVGCLDVDDATGLFTDDVSDSALDFINGGLSLLNAPMPCVPVVVEFRNRLFAMGDCPKLAPAGTVSVVQGSKYIEGDANVEWDRCLEGKFIQLEGDCRPYEIDRVLPPTMGTSPPIARLKLIDVYENPNQTGALYTICGHPSRVYISEPLEPECWPVSNFLDVEPGDGDRIMGGASNFDRLVICKRNKTYALAFSVQPATEVNVPSRISSDIGCIAPRSFAQVESGTVWLADRGLALYDGRSVQHIPESVLSNSIFVDEDNPRYIRRDSNGRVIEAVGVFYPKREQYLLLLPTVRSDRGADLMLVWDTKLRNVTLLEFCQQFQSMVVGKDSDGIERVYLGDANGFVWIFDVGDNDGAGFPNQTGTLRGKVAAAGIESTSGASFLDDSTASFVEGGLPGLAGLSGIVGLSGAVESGDLGLAGACVFTRAAGAALDDPWTSHFIFAATSTRLYVTPGWSGNTPAVGDDYMIGAIDMTAIFKPSDYGTDDQLKRDWQQIVIHEPESVASSLRVELIPDFAFIDDEELTVIDKDDTVGKGRVFDLSFPRGRQQRPVGRRIYNFMQVKMTNFAPDEPVRILNHILRSRPV